jgi:hypothetical protein
MSPNSVNTGSRLKSLGFEVGPASGPVLVLALERDNAISRLQGLLRERRSDLECPSNGFSQPASTTGQLGVLAPATITSSTKLLSFFFDELYGLSRLVSA